MYFEEYEFAATHEAGHMIYIEQFYPAQTGLFPLPPETLLPRTVQVEIWYRDKEARYDGQVVYSGEGLQIRQNLLMALSGRVAEIMARTESNWDVTAMQKRILCGEFDETRDLENAKIHLAKLIADNQSNEYKQLLAEAISEAFSFLKEYWELVMQVSADVLGVYDRENRTATIIYNDFSPKVKAQLHRLKQLC